jgi:hypothetical protein
MLITDSHKLKTYASEKRTWQGIPGIERTKNGRIFVTFYSGGISEQRGNYALLVKSDNGGKSFSEPIAVSYLGEDARAYDPTLWIDPLGRLWFIWSVIPNNRVEFAICNDPDADTLVWEPVRTLGFDIMLNKPTVLKNGDWLFPCAVWEPTYANRKTWEPVGHPSGAHVFVSRDKGKTFSLLGTATGEGRSFDEHMILEQKDGTLAMYLRMKYGVGISKSHDGGNTWTEIRDSDLKGPCSRIHIRRLRSGRVLLINHYNYTGRNNLTALLSEDDGKSFPYSLLLDERDNVSYPDVTEGKDGYLYVAYDRERGAQYRENTDYSNHAREILMAKLTEADIISGTLVSPESQLKTVVSRLGYRPKP